jgi:phosphoglycolate phosphatase-like HAD superfamily hydrolase
MRHEQCRHPEVDVRPDERHARRSHTKAVIFDFDGVIVESADIKTQAFLDLFAEYPQHRARILRHHLDNLGISRFRKFDWIYSELLRRPLSADEKERLGSAFSGLVLNKVLTCELVPGALASLEALRAANRTLFVASGTPQEELEIIIERRGLGSFFAEIWGTPTTKVEIISSILSRFQLDKMEVVLVGDGLSDFNAASEAGIPFIARDNGTGDVDWHSMGIEPIADLRTLLEKSGIGELAVENRS